MSSPGCTTPSGPFDCGRGALDMTESHGGGAVHWWSDDAGAAERRSRPNTACAGAPAVPDARPLPVERAAVVAAGSRCCRARCRPGRGRVARGEQPRLRHSPRARWLDPGRPSPTRGRAVVRPGGLPAPRHRRGRSAAFCWTKVHADDAPAARRDLRDRRRPRLPRPGPRPRPRAGRPRPPAPARASTRRDALRRRRQRAGGAASTTTSASPSTTSTAPTCVDAVAEPVRSPTPTPTAVGDAGRDGRDRQLRERPRTRTDRPVKRASSAPTTTAATAPSDDRGDRRAAVPEPKNHGSSGTSAPTANGDERRHRRAPRRAELSRGRCRAPRGRGSRARGRGRASSPRRARRPCRVDAPRLVDLRELDRLDVRVPARARGARWSSSRSSSSALRLHRHVLAGRHRERARRRGRPARPGARRRAPGRRRRRRGSATRSTRGRR